MSICYDENEPRNFNRPIDIYKINPHKPYEQHLRNQFYLNFIATNKLASFSEKRQAEKELVICQRKLDYWERHPSFDKVQKEQIMQRVKKEWLK